MTIIYLINPSTSKLFNEVRIVIKYEDCHEMYWLIILYRKSP